MSEHPTIPGVEIKYVQGVERAIDHERVFIAAWTDEDGTGQFIIEMRGDEFTTDEALVFAEMIRDQAEWLGSQGETK